MAYFRCIFRLLFTITPSPGMSCTELCVPLNRAGQTAGRGSNGRPRPPVKRTIDLRVGDHILSSGRWKEVLAVEVDCDWWIDEETSDITTVAHGEGYLYRPKKQPVEMPTSQMVPGGRKWRVKYADGEVLL